MYLFPVANLADVLTPDEVTLLASYLYDGERQTALAERGDCCQTSVSYRLRRAAAKLNEADFPVKLPGRGRRRERVHSVRVAPDVMDRLIVDDQDEDLFTTASRWN